MVEGQYLPNGLWELEPSGSFELQKEKARRVEIKSMILFQPSLEPLKPSTQRSTSVFQHSQS